ncbi:MAG TPA: HD domain-containing protein [Spirochaetota bacterium]|nr:HD domain-containing protein [Spirochaetota bacterium]
MTTRKWSTIQNHPAIALVLESEEFKRLGAYTHHGSVTRMEHCLQVARLTYFMARGRGLDAVSAARGALLHDFFFYDWRTDGPRLHGFRHPAIARRNARTRFPLNAIEEDAILRHMWPLTPLPPRYAESALVCVADKLVALHDFSRALRAMRQRFGFGRQRPFKRTRRARTFAWAKRLGASIQASAGRESD